jgi:hypothetical protein
MAATGAETVTVTATLFGRRAEAVMGAAGRAVMAVVEGVTWTPQDVLGGITAMVEGTARRLATVDKAGRRATDSGRTVIDTPLAIAMTVVVMSGMDILNGGKVVRSYLLAECRL